MSWLLLPFVVFEGRTEAAHGVRAGGWVGGINGGWGGGTGGITQYVRGNYRSFEGTNLTVGCRGNASLYITCLVLFIILADLMSGVVQYTTQFLGLVCNVL